jgi:hypothetical protein
VIIAGHPGEPTFGHGDFAEERRGTARAHRSDDSSEENKAEERDDAAMGSLHSGIT